LAKSAPSYDNSNTPTDQKTYVPPISMMAVIGFTNTQAPQPPPTAPYSPNNNVVVSPLSFFYGGAITDHIGAFIQVTYPGQPVTAAIGNDPFATHTWFSDNTDIRYANSAMFGSVPVIYGITTNNNPTVQDPWNTTPAWAFPYASSTVAPTPFAGTIINGAFASQVGSVGAYAFINDALFLEASVYHSLNPNILNALGVDPFGAPGKLDWAPYWRAAYEPHWGNHWLEVGTFGMLANIHPFTSGPTAPAPFPPVPVTFATSPQAVTYTDIGFDTQYQYQGDNFWITVRGSYVHENQYDPNFLLAPTNATNTLNEARAYASLAYGNNNRVVLTGQYFNTWGSSDVGLYGGIASGFSPNSDGFIAEIAYIPFISNFAPGWPWFNARVGLQYTYYNKFDGTTAGAQANNTLFLYLWVAM